MSHVDVLLLEVECADGVGDLVSDGLVTGDQLGRNHATELLIQLGQEFRVTLDTCKDRYFTYSETVGTYSSCH